MSFLEFNYDYLKIKFSGKYNFFFFFESKHFFDKKKKKAKTNAYFFFDMSHYQMVTISRLYIRYPMHKIYFSFPDNNFCFSEEKKKTDYQL